MYMNTKKGIGIFVMVILVLLAGYWFLDNDKSEEVGVSGEKKLSVVTTLFPLYDFAKVIGGEYADVTLLLPPGVEAHSFDPKPNDMIRIDESDVFVYTGKAMEPWAEDLRKSVRQSVSVVDASQGIELIQEDISAGEEHEHMAEHAFEWAGAFLLEPGEYVWSFAKVNGAYADPAMKMAILASSVSGAEGIESTEKNGEAMLGGSLSSINGGGELVSGSAYRLVFDDTQEITTFRVKIATTGTYVFFMEHMPTEFEGSEHFFKDGEGKDVEPVATEPEESAHHHHHGGADPHIWLDFDNAKKMINTIVRAMGEKDPQHRERYENNASAYKRELDRLDARYREGLAVCQSRSVIYGGHYALGYLAHRYDLAYVAAQGFSPDSEPSAKDMTALVNQMRNENAKSVFYEELSSPKIGEVLARETGAKMFLLNAAHNIGKDDYAKNVSFVSIMEDNLVSLREGLGCGAQ